MFCIWFEKVTFYSEPPLLKVTWYTNEYNKAECPLRARGVEVVGSNKNRTVTQDTAVHVSFENKSEP